MASSDTTQHSDTRAVSLDDLWAFFPSLVVHFRKQGLSLEDAEDLVQETLLAAVTKLHTFRGDSRLSTWVFSIAKRKCLLFWRYRRAQKRTAVEVSTAVALEDAEPGAVAIDPAAGPERHSLDRERYRAVRDEIPRLPEKIREPLLLAVRGVPYKDIARRLRCSVNEVASRIHQARRKLRRVDPGAVTGSRDG
jgi:RNA polymerase sigma-70 factor (ECF subfamily)